MVSLIPIRDDTPYHRFPFVTLGIIGLNVWVFLTVPLSDRVVLEYGAIPCDVLGQCDLLSRQLDQAFANRNPWLTVATSMFVHGNLMHLGGNMLFMWVFGNNVEDRLGHVRYALFYLGCGVVAALTHFVIDIGSQVPVIGASGAVSGVLGAYLFLYPRARVISLVPILFFLPVELSARFLLGMWFVLQLFYGVVGIGQQAGVAFFAHVGGFAAGWLAIRVLAPRRHMRETPARWIEP